MSTRTKLIACTFFVLGACVDNETVGQSSQETAGAGIAATTFSNSLLGLAEIEAKWNGLHSKVEASTRLIQQEIVFQPGGHTGWHTHGGMAFVSITEGTLTLYSTGLANPCAGVAYPAGTAFLDPGFGHVHIARNEGTSEMKVRVQYVLPDGAPARIDAAAPPGACF